MAVISIEPLQAGLGYELVPGGNLPWQMVPLGGARGIKITGAEGRTLQVTNISGGPASGLIFNEVDSNGAPFRIFWLAGITAGSYVVNVIDPESRFVAWSIGVDVLAERSVKVAWYFLPGVMRRFDPTQLTKLINGIWSGPANVTLTSLGVWGNENGEKLDFSGKIDTQAHAGKLRDYGNHGAASWLVYLGWTIAGAEAGTVTKGETRLDQTVIDLALFKDGERASLAHTLAHEMGHFVSRKDPSHDDLATDLMFKKSQHGRNNGLRRKRILQVIRG